MGTDCGTPTATDQSVATQAEVQLGELARHGGSTPSFAFLPAPTSPVVDVIPPGLPGDLDCPTQNGEGRSLDQRGVLRPVGTGCDVGSVELREDELSPPAA